MTIVPRKLPKVDLKTGWKVKGPYKDSYNNATYIILMDSEGKSHKRGYRKYMREIEMGVKAIAKGTKVPLISSTVNDAGTDNVCIKEKKSCVLDWKLFSIGLAVICWGLLGWVGLVVTVKQLFHH